MTRLLSALGWKLLPRDGKDDWFPWKRARPEKLDTIHAVHLMNSFCTTFQNFSKLARACISNFLLFFSVSSPLPAFTTLNTLTCKFLIPIIEHSNLYMMGQMVAEPSVRYWRALRLPKYLTCLFDIRSLLLSITSETLVAALKKSQVLVKFIFSAFSTNDFAGDANAFFSPEVSFILVLAVCWPDFESRQKDTASRTRHAHGHSFGKNMSAFQRLLV